MRYDHLVYFTRKDGAVFLAIDRVFEGGRRDFCTHMELPAVESEAAGFELMDKVAEWLGNSICIDNPEFRRHIKVEETP